MAEIAHTRQASPQALETISKYFDGTLVQDVFFGAAHDTLQQLGFKRWDWLQLPSTELFVSLFQQKNKKNKRQALNY